MFGKLGMSLAALPGVSVHCIGFPGAGAPDEASLIKLHAHTSKPFSRISIARIFAPFRILIKTLRLKPDVFLITTHELLWAALLCKLLTGCPVVYDVQENYFYNILYTKAFPGILRPGLALYVRLKELLCSPFIAFFILAEREYQNELRFARPFLVAENKLPLRIARQFVRKPGANRSALIFSGTLAETTGVHEAIDLALALHAHSPAVTLTLIGNCPSKKFLNKLRQRISGYPFIRFTGGVYPLSHEAILNALREADAGVIIYPPNRSTATSIPTKVYEYLALELPILIRHNEPSHRLVRELNAGIVLPSGRPAPDQILAGLQQGIKPAHNSSIYWESIEKELFDRVQKIL